MRNEKFGDKKDRMKWIKLLELAQCAGICRIVQVTMWTNPNPPPKKPNDVASIVDRFFYGHNDLGKVKDIGKPLGIAIEVWHPPFTGRKRSEYFGDLIKRSIGKNDAPRTVWFFDPDTGIEAPKTCDERHVKKCELRRVFCALPQGDFLAVFQYRWWPKCERCWHDIAQDRLRRACGFPEDEKGRVQVLKLPDVTREAIILAVQKPIRLTTAAAGLPPQPASNPIRSVLSSEPRPTAQANSNGSQDAGATAMTTLSSQKSSHGKTTPNPASAKSMASARKYISTPSATPQAQPVSRPKMRDTRGIL